MSLFDPTAKPLEPCPLQFVAHWLDSDGKNRRHECDDWETSTAFNRFEREYGRQMAIEGFISPSVAIWLPNGILAGLAVVLLSQRETLD